MVRCFVAFDVASPEVVSKVSLLQRELFELGLKARLVDPSSLHVTLQFLGEVSEELVRDVIKQLGEVRFEPFSVRLKGVGYFPGGGRINVVWLGLEDAGGALARVQRDVAEGLRRLGFRPDKEFVPHVTIMRVKSVTDKERVLNGISRLKDLEVGEVFIDALKLKKSTLMPTGAVYEDIYVVRAKK